MSKVRILSPRPENSNRRICGGFNFFWRRVRIQTTNSRLSGFESFAKQLEKQLGARRFTPDEVMIELFGTEVGDDFMDKANKVDEYIWEQIALAIKNGQDVIYDAGSWSANDRKYVMQRLKKLGAEALWHQVNCNIDLAKQRTLARSKDAEQLSVDERFFDENLSRYKPISDSEGLDVVVYNN